MNTKVPLNLDLSINCEKSQEQAIDLLHYLHQVKDSIDYSTDYSVQVLLPLKDGGFLRLGISDANEKECVIFVDRYEGLHIVGGKNLQTGKDF